MTAVDLPLADLDDLGAAVLPVGNSVSMLYAQKSKHPPSVVNIETQEVCSGNSRTCSAGLPRNAETAAAILQVTVSKYEGSRAADGLFEGAGHADFTSGNTYDGLFQRGQIHGQGKYIWTDGLVFTGNFMNNKLSGTGVSIQALLHSSCQMCTAADLATKVTLTHPSASIAHTVCPHHAADIVHIATAGL